jgi:hypothetical protein
MEDTNRRVRGPMEWLHQRIDRRALIGIAVAVFFLDIILGGYHLTHGGPGSGRIELSFAPIFVALIVVALVGRSRQEQSPGWKIARLSVIGVFVLAALLFLGLAVYHFTHEGARSGGMEISAAFLLTILVLSL